MSRRGNGEGGIGRRSDGRWEARVTLPTPTGRPRRKSLYGKTRSEVTGKLTRALSEVQQGAGLVRDERLTVGDYLNSWLDNSVKPNVRARTYQLYEMIVRRHLVPASATTG